MWPEDVATHKLRREIRLEHTRRKKFHRSPRKWWKATRREANQRTQEHPTMTTIERTDLNAVFRRVADPDQEMDAYRRDSRTLIEAGYCPSCACEGHRARLRRWEPGNYYQHAGRECAECEEFYPCGPQGDYTPYYTSSDADPGL